MDNIPEDSKLQAKWRSDPVHCTTEWILEVQDGYWTPVARVVLGYGAYMWFTSGLHHGWAGNLEDAQQHAWEKAAEEQG